VVQALLFAPDLYYTFVLRSTLDDISGYGVVGLPPTGLVTAFAHGMDFIGQILALLIPSTLFSREPHTDVPYTAQQSSRARC
jgi:hypothetical protein